jgi:hypothetical protein
MALSRHLSAMPKAVRLQSRAFESSLVSTWMELTEDGVVGSCLWDSGGNLHKAK